MVCTGNICRSPMGQMMLADALERAGIDAEVTSGATTAYEQGNPIDPRAAACLTRNGVPVLDHTATKVTDDELREADIVLAMTHEHLNTLRRQAERAGADPSQIVLWRSLEEREPDDAGAAGSHEHAPWYLADSDEVPDPWLGDDADFDHTYGLLLNGRDRLTYALGAGETEIAV